MVEMIAILASVLVIVMGYGSDEIVRVGLRAWLRCESWVLAVMLRVRPSRPLVEAFKVIARGRLQGNDVGERRLGVAELVELEGERQAVQLLAQSMRAVDGEYVIRELVERFERSREWNVSGDPMVPDATVPDVGLVLRGMVEYDRRRTIILRRAVVLVVLADALVALVTFCRLANGIK